MKTKSFICIIVFFIIICSCLSNNKFTNSHNNDCYLEEFTINDSSVLLNYIIAQNGQIDNFLNDSSLFSLLFISGRDTLYAKINNDSIKSKYSNKNINLGRGLSNGFIDTLEYFSNLNICHILKASEGHVVFTNSPNILLFIQKEGVLRYAYIEKNKCFESFDEKDNQKFLRVNKFIKYLK